MTTGIELIVGLANPGSQYEATRHNAGAWFVEYLCQQYPIQLRQDKKLFCQIAKLDVAGQSCKLAIPSTYMNESGRSVAALANYYKIPVQNILVAHDEIDLPVGDVRLKAGGGHGGHNGLRDIQQHLGNNKFHRLRIGVGHPGHKDQVVNYVLGRPSADDQIEIERSIVKASEQLEYLLSGEWQKAQTSLHSA